MFGNADLTKNANYAIIALLTEEVLMNRAFNLNPYVRLVPAGDFFTTLSDTESPGLWPTSGVARLWQVHLGRNPDAPVFAFAFFANF